MARIYDWPHIDLALIFLSAMPNFIHMSTLLPFDLRQRCLSSDGGILASFIFDVCCEGFSSRMEIAARRTRLAPIVVFGSFVALAVFTLLYSFSHARGPYSLESFAGMIAWVVIFYGLAGRELWTHLQSAGRLKSGRESDWLTMMSEFVFAALHIIETVMLVILARLIVRLNDLRACLRIRLGLADPNLIAYRLVPPLVVHA